MNRRRPPTENQTQNLKANGEEDFFNEFSEVDSKRAQGPAEPAPEVKDQIIKKNMLTRAKTGFAIFGSFVLINMLGHFYCALLVYAIQIGIFREIIGLKRNYERERPVRASPFILWYIFIVGTLFIFVWFFSDKLLLTHNETIHFILKYRSIIFFSLYLAGFLSFVISLKMGYIRYQIRLFIETHLILLLAMATSGAMVIIYEGQIWFIIAALCVILNDVCAYQIGVVYGKTKLIDISPKKTVEGFIGGLVGSLIVMRLVI